MPNAKKSFEMESICTICFDTKIDPVTVKCGHSFCAVCYENLKKSSRFGRPTRCPLCRMVLTRNTTADGGEDDSSVTFGSVIFSGLLAAFIDLNSVYDANDFSPSSS